MPILKRFVPEPTNIKDYRDSGGVHFEAKCDQCGRIYYPKRSTAKYCSKICAIEFRRGGILQKETDASNTKRKRGRPKKEKPVEAPNKPLHHAKKKTTFAEWKAQRAKKQKLQELLRKAREKKALQIANQYRENPQNP